MYRRKMIKNSLDDEDELLSTDPSTVSTTISNSARKRFFADFLPQLENHVADSLFDEGPSFDLTEFCPTEEEEQSEDNEEICNITGQQGQQHDAEPNKHIHQGEETNDDENDFYSVASLEILANQLKNRTSYGLKLAKIMLNGLKADAAPLLQLLHENKLPEENWIPVIHFNDNNTPIVEYMYKSPQSHLTPFQQLTSYTATHMILSKFIIKQLLEIYTIQQTTVTVYNKDQQQPSKQHQKQKQPQPKPQLQLQPLQKPQQAKPNQPQQKRQDQQQDNRRRPQTNSHKILNSTVKVDESPSSSFMDLSGETSRRESLSRSCKKLVPYSYK